MDSVISKKGKYDRSSTATALGYDSYKDVKFDYITGIHIDKFRSFVNRDIRLGKHITLLTGKNGTMKSSLLGLIAHPFNSPNNAKDMYGKDLKTKHSDVFKLSLDKDKEEYIYYLQASTTNDQNLSEPIRIYQRDKRHRVTVGPDNKASMGNFLLNTSYLNLKRLFPIIETNAERANIEISGEDQSKISRAYQRIIQRDTYSSSEAISDSESKHTLAPTNSYYDFNSISSGEDNLGFILCKMLAFEKYRESTDSLQGLLCIDEMEASLHPVAQINLLNYLKEWSKKNHIQVIITTHSLFLVDHCLRLQLSDSASCDEIVINNISTQGVGNDKNYNIMINPDFNTIYKELTYKDASAPGPYKVNIICEDDVAKKVVRRIVKSQKILDNLSFISNVSGAEGSSWTALRALVKNGQNLLADSIVVLDPDVPQGEIERLNYDYILKIPDFDNTSFCIEQRAVSYLFNLDGSDPLFKEREKDAILSDLANNYRIFRESLENTPQSNF